MEATPLEASTARSSRRTTDRYQPWSPSVPDSEAVDRGGDVSMRIVTERMDSSCPARSVAKNSRTCEPSTSTTTGSTGYLFHPPPSRRYVVHATPATWSSEAKV